MAWSPSSSGRASTTRTAVDARVTCAEMTRHLVKEVAAHTLAGMDGFTLVVETLAKLVVAMKAGEDGENSEEAQRMYGKALLLFTSQSKFRGVCHK